MEKILIVDNNLSEAAHLKSIFDLDYDVTIVQTAENALHDTESGDYIMILLEVELPDMDGFTLLKKFQENPNVRNVPVIFVTNLCDTGSELHAFALGAADYIKKPFLPEIVRARAVNHIRLYQHRRQVELQSMTDQLTGLPNRREYDCYSIIKWNEAIRLQVPFSVCMFDIDKFKEYNDTYGHPAGDRVLVAVANIISTYLQRSTDFSARYGGEEFVAILLGDTAEKAFEVLKRIRQAVEDLHIPHKENPVSEWVTISIGGTTLVPDKWHTYEAHLKIADTMLYKAKDSGRNQVVWTAGSDTLQWHEK